MLNKHCRMLLAAALLVPLTQETPVAQASVVSGSLGAYWTFDSYDDQTIGIIPSSYYNRGAYEDVSGNGNILYAGFGRGASDENPALYNLTNATPYDATGGRFGGAFYSASNTTRISDGASVALNGSIGVANNSPTLDFTAGQSFTISFWEKAGVRTTATNNFNSPGRGRGGFFAQVVNSHPDGTPSYNPNGLHYGIDGTQQVGFFSETDSFAQTPLIRTPHQSIDNGQWAQHVIVGTYQETNGGEVAFKTFINGEHWEELDFVRSAALIDTDGYFSVGGIWRSYGAGTPAPSRIHQRGFWNQGEGFMDDFAFFSGLNLEDGEAMAIYNLAETPELNYTIGDVTQVLDVFRAGSGSVTIGDKTWAYSNNPADFTAGLGQVGSAGGFYSLLLGDGIGVITTAGEPTFVLGDMNGDGVLNNLDIAPFELALVDTAAYLAAYPGLAGDYLLRGDIDNDGSFNNLDISPFEHLLVQPQGFAVNAVPEPTSGLLLLVGTCACFARRRRGQARTSSHG